MDAKDCSQAFPEQVVINAAPGHSCLCIQEGSVKKTNSDEWKPRREFVNLVTHNYFDGQIPQEEKFENTARVDGNLQGDSDTHSRTSLSSKYDDTDDDLLDSDWETRPVAELEDDSKYEREDWDKELCDACPYDSEDVMEIESHQKTYICEESKTYDPSCHHAEPVTLILPGRCSEFGQFDDADD
ncbi:coordinator of PRMT5 and differentiation stimulator isoform X2 [Pleurodeles waltl]|uniref:coordinator of PRMT5 and differentiation stimulator isoform X2 n=1 Tax=Pleurodeles waltl TaxID=8319 RepID=UPI0037094F70